MKINRGVSNKARVVAIVITLIGILIILVPLSLFGYYKYNQFALKNDTYDDLASKGYSESEIKKVDTINTKGPLLSTLVEFSDEPDVLYWYDKRQGHIVQIGIYEPSGADENKFKHTEK